MPLLVTGCASEPPRLDPEFAVLPATAVVERDEVRMTLAIDRLPLQLGTPHEALVTVLNLGADDAIYATNDCGLAVEAAYRPPGDWNDVGIPQVGFAAAFKELASAATRRRATARAPISRRSCSSASRAGAVAMSGSSGTWSPARASSSDSNGTPGRARRPARSR